ncbi:hypothetical protein BDR04DRAFT_1101905 [Suillus decipiens]|nr:hypothetical protein BDR04DRAFT_1101905 [Suillus decipiens]
MIFTSLTPMIICVAAVAGIATAQIPSNNQTLSNNQTASHNHTGPHRFKISPKGKYCPETGEHFCGLRADFKPRAYGYYPQRQLDAHRASKVITMRTISRMCADLTTRLRTIGDCPVKIAVPGNPSPITEAVSCCSPLPSESEC